MARLQALSARQTTLTGFGRVTKSTPLTPIAGKTLKRKAEDEADGGTPTTPQLNVVGTVGKNSEALIIQVPNRGSISNQPSPQTPVPTPTRALTGAIKRMKLGTAQSGSPTPPRTRVRTRASDPSSQIQARGKTSASIVRPINCLTQAQKADGEWVPEPVQDLIMMASSVLTSLSIHYAHAGSTSPAPVLTLIETATRLWGRRQVSVDDIRLVLGVLADAESVGRECDQSLSIISYNARSLLAVDTLLIELSHPQSHGRFKFEELALLQHLRSVLAFRWNLFARRAGSLARPDRFIDCLPRLEVLISTSVALSSAASRVQRGQAALQIIQSARNSTMKPVVPISLPSPTVPAQNSLQSRQNLLLQKLEARSVAAASLNSSQSPLDKARSTGLSVIPQLLRIIKLLLTRDTGFYRNCPNSRPFISPTTFSLIQLRQAAAAAHIPLSSFECGLSLLSELSSGYVKIRKWQNVTAIVVSGIEPSVEAVAAWA